MKTALVILAGCVTVSPAFAQGRVSFRNTASSNYYLWTNNPYRNESGLMSGTNAFRIGLYASTSVGAGVWSLSLIGLTTNAAALPGRFLGPSPFVLPAAYVAGQQMTFQIRAWSLWAGMTWEEKESNRGMYIGRIYDGWSALGTVTPTPSPSPAAELFGTNPGQLNTGFWILPPIPEPSTHALALLGATAMLMFSRRRRRAYRMRNKTALVLLAGCVTVSTACGQGRVSFRNTASSNYYIWTNNVRGTAPGLMSGTNAYRIGLYASTAVGAFESSLTLIGLTTNSAALPGRFLGPSPFALPAQFVAGQAMTFQLRGWSLWAGTSWEEMEMNPDFHYVQAGWSALGTVIPTASPSPAAELFGTNPGQLSSGFWMTPPIPEPSVRSLAILGAVAWWMARRRRAANRP